LEFDQESKIGYQRVAIEAVDFDWIFRDDNAKTLILLLTQFGRKKLYKAESLRIFIELMWQYYQPAIIKWVFIPYLVYMITMIYIAS